MEPNANSEAPTTVSEPSNASEPQPQTTWSRLWAVAEQLAKQMDCITDLLDETTQSLASDDLGEALLKFDLLDNRLKEEFDRFSGRFSSTPRFKAMQEELWAAPEPRRRKKPPPPPKKKRGRPRKNAVGAP